MPVCKYYLKGNCRYGDRCYNEHRRDNVSNRRQERWEEDDYGGSWQGRSNNHNQYSRSQTYNRSSNNFYDNRYSSPVSTSNQGYKQDTRSDNNFSDNRYSSPVNTSTQGYKQDKYHWSRNNRFSALEQEEKPDNNTDLMFSTIQSDVKVWAESKMWPFSCYSYTKESGCIEGLPDISPEEMRVLAVLHSSEYLNILNEIEIKYCRVKDELFAMSDATKSSLVSQMNNADSNPSQDLMISSLYGPKFNFSSENTSEQLSETVVSPQTSISFKSNDQFQNLSNLSSFGTPVSTIPAPSTPASNSTKISQNISVFGASTPSISNNATVVDEVYTNEDSLTDDERKKFGADRFTVGEIPTRPPSQQYCR